MFNIILIGLGVLLSAVLIIENMVISSSGSYFFLTIMNTGVVLFFSILIGIAIGFGIKGFLSKEDKSEEDDYNF